MTKLYYIFLLLICVIGCSSYGDEDEEEIRGVFPGGPVTEAENQPPAHVVPPVATPVVEEEEVAEEIVVEPEPEPDEEEEEPVDNTPPSLVKSTVLHGAIGVDVDTDRFVFTFDEEIDIAHVTLVNNALELDMEWTTFIEGKRVVLLRLADEGGHRMAHGELYTIQLRWADAAGNWEPEKAGFVRVITFVTEIKE